jgi:hypothetical protein
MHEILKCGELAKLLSKNSTYIMQVQGNTQILFFNVDLKVIYLFM